MNNMKIRFIFKLFKTLILMLTPIVVMFVIQSACLVMVSDATMMPEVELMIRIVLIQSLLYNVLFGCICVIWYFLRFVRKGDRGNVSQSRNGIGITWSKLALISGSILALGIGVQCLAATADRLMQVLFPEMAEFYRMISNGTIASGELVAFVTAFCMIIIGPIAEEVAFRGLTLRYANQIFPFWIANIIQAVLFGVAHMNPLQGIYCTVTGLILGYFYYRGGGLKYTILGHMFLNLLSCIIPSEIYTLMNSWVVADIVVFIVLLPLSIWLFRKAVLKSEVETYVQNS